MKFRDLRRTWLKDESGSALVAVLFISTLVAGITVALLVLARQAAQVGDDISADVQNRVACEAGINRIVLAYSRRGDSLREKLVGDARSVAWDFLGKTLILRVQAESGKLDLNAGDRNHIAALARRLIPEVGAQLRFLSRLDSARAQGLLITSPLVLLSPFDRMTSRRDLIEAHFTVLTGQRGFDPRTAPEAVLETAPVLSDEAKQQILSARADGKLLNANGVAFPRGQMFVSEKPLYTFRVEVNSGLSRPAAMTAQVEFSDQGRIHIFSWATGTPHLYN
jgi:hypothetical protein